VYPIAGQVQLVPGHLSVQDNRPSWPNTPPAAVTRSMTKSGASDMPTCCKISRTAWSTRSSSGWLNGPYRPASIPDGKEVAFSADCLLSRTWRLRRDFRGFEFSSGCRVMFVEENQFVDWRIRPVL
jgi:hypothetical protein